MVRSSNINIYLYIREHIELSVKLQEIHIPIILVRVWASRSR